MGFRLLPTSVTSNDFKRQNGPYFALFDSFAGRLRHSSTLYRLIGKRIG